MNFKELQISSKTIDALADMGYNEPTEVQEKTIPSILEGREIIVRSKTGSGKTAAFGIGMIEQIAKDRTKQGMILAPTRELAIQITNELRKIARRHRMDIYPIYGGQSIEKQINQIKRGFSIVVGTPGRMLDHLRRGTLKLDKINWVVLDEADLMLDMGFEEDIREIIRQTKDEKQMLLFSATIDERIKSIAGKYMKQPEIIEIGSLDVEEIKEETMIVRKKLKFRKLIDLINEDPNRRTIVFVATKRSVEYVCDRLNEDKINASYIHGDKTQKQREKTINGFKKGHFPVLVATDVASRGLHIDNVGLIVNFDQADSSDTHKHRIGRTGRMGNEGRAVTFIVEDDRVSGNFRSHRGTRPYNDPSQNRRSYGGRSQGGRSYGSRSSSRNRDSNSGSSYGRRSSSRDSDSRGRRSQGGRSYGGGRPSSRDSGSRSGGSYGRSSGDSRRKHTPGKFQSRRKKE